MSYQAMTIKHWRVEKDENNIAWLHFDMLDAKANLLSQAAIAELYELLDGLSKDLPQGIVICSDKQDSFIFGAISRNSLRWITSTRHGCSCRTATT